MPVFQGQYNIISNERGRKIKKIAMQLNSLIEEFIGEHEGDDGEAELAALEPADMRVAELEAVDVVQRENDDALADLRRAEECAEERDECR